MRYVIYKDYKTGVHHRGYEYITVEAKDPFELFEIADKEWAVERGRLYLMKIMKKVGKSEKDDFGWRSETYEAVAVKRSDAVGWHRSIQANSEGRHVAERRYRKDIECFTVII